MKPCLACMALLASLLAACHPAAVAGVSDHTKSGTIALVDDHYIKATRTLLEAMGWRAVLKDWLDYDAGDPIALTLQFASTLSAPEQQSLLNDRVQPALSGALGRVVDSCAALWAGHLATSEASRLTQLFHQKVEALRFREGEGYVPGGPNLPALSQGFRNGLDPELEASIVRFHKAYPIVAAQCESSAWSIVTKIGVAFLEPYVGSRALGVFKL